MSAANALAEPTPPPDPLGDQDDFVIPHRILRIFAVIRALLDFGHQRMGCLEQSGELTSAFTRAFGTADWDQIWWDITWGLLLLEALTDWVKDLDLFLSRSAAETFGPRVGKYTSTRSDRKQGP